MKILFMGTPDFAVETLRALCDAGHEIVCAVTQPDKARGRGGKVSFPAVKEYAVSQGIEVFQPVKVREPECVEKLRTYQADIFVVAAFGQILPDSILSMPKYGCICVHASLLPRYRGAAPIQRAILEGEEKSGVTIMQMDEGIDTGDMLARVEVTIEDNETGGSLHDKLAVAGANLCIETIEKIQKDEIIPEKQVDADSCYAKMLDKKLGQMDWNLSAVELERLVRGLNPWPSAYTQLNGKTLKIWFATVMEDVKGKKPGEIALIDKNELLVQTGKGCLSLEEVQLEGKKRMQIDEFLRGCKVTADTRLGG